MKKSIIMLFIAIVMIVIIPKFSVAGDAEKLCKAMSEIAVVVMEYRQNGVPMSKLMDVVDEKSGNDSGAINRTTRMMITEAYEKPRYSLEKNQKKAIRRFENWAYLECYKANTDN